MFSYASLNYFGYFVNVVQQVNHSKPSGLSDEILFLQIRSDISVSADLMKAVYYLLKPQILEGIC